MTFLTVGQANKTKTTKKKTFSFSKGESKYVGGERLD